MGRGGFIGIDRDIQFSPIDESSGIWTSNDVVRNYESWYFGRAGISTFSSNVGNTTISYPTGINYGDLILLIATEATTGAMSGVPLGWSEISSLNNDPSIIVATKNADGTETGNVTVNNADRLSILVFSKQLSVITSFDSVGSIASGAGTASPSLTPSRSGLLVAIITIDNAGSGLSLSSTDGMTLQFSNSSSGQTQQNVLIQNSVKDTTYNKTLTYSGSSSTTRAVLLNII